MNEAPPNVNDDKLAILATENNNNGSEASDNTGQKWQHQWKETPEDQARRHVRALSSLSSALGSEHNKNYESNDINSDEENSSGSPSCSDVNFYSAGRPTNNGKTLEDFRRFLDQYLELPSMIDPFLEMMVNELTDQARQIMRQRISNTEYDEYDRNLWSSSSLPYILSGLYAISKVRGYKHVQTKLPHTVDDVQPVLNTIRSLKRYISHHHQQEQTHHLPSSSHCLPSSANHQRPPLWESLYTMWNWLSILSKVPFDCGTMLNEDEEEAHHSNSRQEMSLETKLEQPKSQITQLFDMAFEDLSSTGAVREISASCLASWLIRPDIFEEVSGRQNLTDRSCNNYYYGLFQVFACDLLEQFCNDAMFTSRTSPSSNSASRMITDRRLLLFTTLGILQVLVTMIKKTTSSRDMVLSKISPFLEPTTRLQQIFLQSDGAMTTKSSSSSSPIQRIPMNDNLLLRKYLVKWWTRLAMLYLPPQSAVSSSSWRYQRGSRSLQDNLTMSTMASTTTTNSSTIDTPMKEDLTVKALITTRGERGSQVGPTTENNTLKDVDCYGPFFIIPDEVEVFSGHVLSAICDVSTPVRWSAAKGVGRITSRLPALCGEDILDAILSMFHDKERDDNWHGACLALAELSRRGLIPLHRFDDVIPKIVEAIQYDVPRRQTSVGQHVRDAACYTYWATARAYAPDVLRPFVSQLGRSVVTTFLFDREVNCRRAASAAFQEMVGRQGADNVPHGISILTTADYFSLGNRTDSFVTIAPQIASFIEYRASIVDCIYQVKLSHWDRHIRELASKSLGALTNVDACLICKKVIPYVVENCVNESSMPLRHGSTLGLAEIIMVLGSHRNHEYLLPPESVKTIAELVPTIEKKRLYRGKGGEYMRQAACRLIESISTTKLPLSVIQTVRLLDSLDTCLSHPSEVVQEQACQALASLMSNYFPVGPKGPSERLQNRVVGKYTRIVESSVNPAETRGFSLALGVLPAKLLAPSPEVLNMPLSCLCHASHPNTKVGTEKDAETRRNSLISLVRVVRTVGLVAPPSIDCTNPQYFLSANQLDSVFLAHLRALGDYNVDQRGDVGSMCRQEAMRGLVQLSLLSCTGISDFNAKSEYFSEAKCLKIIQSLLKQFCEKLDSIRAKAAHCLLELVDDNSVVASFVTKRKELFAILHSAHDGDHCEEGSGINWSNGEITFPLAMKIADIDEYFECVVNGLVLSVGGLTKTVADNSLTALVKWTRSASQNQIQHLGEVFLSMFNQNHRRLRVIIPLLKTIELLIDRLCLEVLIAQDSFSSSLLEKLRAEVSETSDISCISATLNVASCLLSPSSAIHKHAVAFVCGLLQHPFPHIRRSAAEKLYVRLLETNFETYDGRSTGINILLNHPWDSDGCEGTDTATNFQDAARQVLQALQVEHKIK